MSINLGVAVSIKDYDEIHEILNNLKIQYKIHTGRKCTKGKALSWAIKHGKQAFIKLLEEQARDATERARRLKEQSE